MALPVALWLVVMLPIAVRLVVLLPVVVRLDAMLLVVVVRLDVLLPGAALLATVLLDALLREPVPPAVVASVPPKSKLGAPSMALRPTLVVVSSPLSVGVSESLGHPVAL